MSKLRNFRNFAVTIPTDVALRIPLHFFRLTMFCLICSLHINYDLHSFCFDVYTIEKVKIFIPHLPIFVLFDLFFLFCCCSRMEKIRISMFWLTIFCLIRSLTIINDHLFQLCCYGMEKVIGKVKCYTLHCLICTLRNYTIICFHFFV